MLVEGSMVFSPDYAVGHRAEARADIHPIHPVRQHPTREVEKL
jgi:hypothetical protein